MSEYIHKAHNVSVLMSNLPEQSRGGDLPKWDRYVMNHKLGIFISNGKSMEYTYDGTQESLRQIINAFSHFIN
jgi:hypothetical protein